MVYLSRRPPFPTIMVPSWAMVAEVLGLVPEKWVAFSTPVFPSLAFPARLGGEGVLFFPTFPALFLLVPPGGTGDTMFLLLYQSPTGKLPITMTIMPMSMRLARVALMLTLIVACLMWVEMFCLTIFSIHCLNHIF